MRIHLSFFTILLFSATAFAGGGGGGGVLISQFSSNPVYVRLHDFVDENYIVAAAEIRDGEWKVSQAVISDEDLRTNASLYRALRKSEMMRTWQKIEDERTELQIFDR